MAQPLPAYKGDEPYVFVSYSHADTDVVFHEIARLQGQNINVWYDTTGIGPGSEWNDNIARAIQNAAHFIYFITPQSVASEHCRRELNFAQAEGRSVIAVHLETTAVPPGLRLSLDNRQAIFKYGLGEDEYQSALVTSLTASPSNPPTSPTFETKSTSGTAKMLATGLTILLVVLLGAGLWIWSGTDGPAEPGKYSSIAIVPFENFTGDPDQQYVVDGMTVMLIAELSKVSGLVVKSRASVMRYKDTDKPATVIGQELNADIMVEGSLSKGDDEVRVTVQLIETAGDRNLWTESYIRPYGDILNLQAEVARAIVREIRVQLTTREEAWISIRQDLDPVAVDSFLKGKYLLDRFADSGRMDDESFEAMIGYLNQAISLEPEWANAHAQLAKAYHWPGARSPNESFPRAKESALRALALDPDNPDALFAIAYLAYQWEWDWDAADRANRRFVELTPNPSWGSIWDFLKGDYEVAIRTYRAAERRNDSLILKEQLGDVYICAREYDSAIQQLQKVLALDSSRANARLLLAGTYSRQGNFAQAFNELDRYTESWNSNPAAARFLRSLLHLRQGHTEEARALLEESSSFNALDPYAKLQILMPLGETERAVAELEQAFAQRHNGVLRLHCLFEYEKLLEIPRAREIIAEIGLWEI